MREDRIFPCMSLYHGYVVEKIKEVKKRFTAGPAGVVGDISMIILRFTTFRKVFHTSRYMSLSKQSEMYHIKLYAQH